MPLYIDGKRVHNRDVWLKHKSLVSQRVEYQRFIRGGNPEYIKELRNIKKQIVLNKVLA
jgi:hypothetical protein